MTDPIHHPTLSSGSQKAAAIAAIDEGTPSPGLPFSEVELERVLFPERQHQDSETPFLASSLLSSESSPSSRRHSSPRRKYRPVVTIAGEDFLLSREDGYIFLSHPEWSITGFGKSLLDAERHLKQRIQRMYSDLLETPASEMTIRALDLRDFLIKIYGIN